MVLAAWVLACVGTEPSPDTGTGTTGPADVTGCPTGPAPGGDDRDGDGYADDDEAHAGTDPDDPDDVIYQGGWPYRRDKLDDDPAAWDQSPDEGAVLPRLQAVDQFGDTVDVYDFCGGDRPIILDTAAAWCGPCQQMAAWLAGQDSAFVASERWADVPGQVSRGEVLWITVLLEGPDHLAPTAQAVSDWHALWPNPAVPVLADQDQRLDAWLDLVSLPSLQLLDPELVLQVYDPVGYERALDGLVD